ncbi:peptidylprolyl isomerase [Candidatus Micrarchaeota archaeon]|nr:peptidylprolyl isomerase [Candidatus Micrarchaeota archaeon]MBU1930616.1 peptidylprolyl isomerase [Candidatus Micrarchaeota archaeon]
MTETVQNGDTIKVNYRGTLDDGTEFDSSLKPGRTPLEFAVGAGQMIKGFDAAVVGMALNEEKTVTLEPADAYGETNPEMIQEFSKEAFGELFDQLTIGQQIQASNGLIGVVLEKTDSTAKLDFNHELAGKKLTFWIQIVEIQKA